MERFLDYRNVAMNGRNRPAKGFVALISVIVIAALLLASILTVGAAQFFARMSLLDLERHAESRFLALSCAEIAEERLEENSVYTPSPGGDCVGVADTCGSGGAVCSICSVSASGNTVSIITRASYGGSYTTLTVTGLLSGGAFTPTRQQTNSLYAGPACIVH